MSLTGACRFTAAWCSVVAAVWCAECQPVKLTPAQRMAQVRDLDRAAQAAMAAGKFSEAVAKMRLAACLTPDSSHVLYSRGIAEAAAGDLKSARVSLREAARLQPNSSLPLAMEVRVNAGLEDLEALKASLRETARRFPGDAELHAALARFLTGKKLYDLALAESLRAQGTRVADAAAAVEAAGLENTAGAYGDAVRNATRIENDSSLPTPVRSAAAGIAGLSYAGMGQPQEAARHLQEAIRLDPSRENSYLALADVFEKAQQSEKAAETLEAGRRALPQADALLAPLGADLVLAERYKEGLAVLRGVVRRAPENTEAYLQIASACRNLADAPGELEALRAVERAQPAYPQIHLFLARALLNFEPADYEKVLTELGKAEAQTPEDPDLFYLRGKTYAATHRMDEAVAAFRHAIELRPLEPGAYYQLGRVYQQLGKSELAREQMERVRTLGTAPNTR